MRFYPRPAVLASTGKRGKQWYIPAGVTYGEMMSHIDCWSKAEVKKNGMASSPR